MEQENARPNNASSTSRPNRRFDRQHRHRPNGQGYSQVWYRQPVLSQAENVLEGPSVVSNGRRRNWHWRNQRPKASSDAISGASASSSAGNSSHKQPQRNYSHKGSEDIAEENGQVTGGRTNGSSRFPRNFGTRSHVLQDNVSRRSRPVVDTGDPESQRKKMEELLRNGSYECMICCEEITKFEQVWNCYDSCYNIFHLKCISTWACSNVKSSENSDNPNVADDSEKKGWRCPACQSVIEKIPNKYFCFCGKKRNPEPDNNMTPHSCGQMCSKRKNNSKISRCVHRCQLLCHPGPCPPCDIGIRQSCSCGKTSVPIACGASGREQLTCDNVCGKLLSCQKHNCNRKCHPGNCDPCVVELAQKCFCTRHEKRLTCEPNVTQDSLSPYSCGEKCNKKLLCGNHICTDVCHDGPCRECKFLPGFADSCPCGKTPIDNLDGKERTKCTDPLPVCNATCGKRLRCGPLNDLHKCAKTCHNGVCGPCQLKTSIQCQCSATTETIECKKLKERSFKCTRRCNKKMSCNRHKCQKICCKKNDDHVCSVTCQKKLPCGRHKCPEVCHPGPCPPCWNVSWQELTCTCGEEVILPPISCGTEVPACNRPCNRRHACSHPVDHTCHQEVSCPPCTYSTSKYCFGSHKLMNNVLCCLPGVSCGKPCGKRMSCGLHACQRACHEGTCGECRYSCTKIRSCGHLCNQNCHELTSPNSCPSAPCRIMITVYCSCKRLSDKRTCDEINYQNHRLPVTLLARLKIGGENEIDINNLIKEGEAHKYIRLECDAKCLQMERNRNLADALSIADPDVHPDPGVKYSESLKQAFLQHPDFVRETYNQLVTVVKGLEKSKNNFSFFNFPAMRKDLRAIVHELAEVFKCKSHSVDQEPNRSVVVKAQKDKSVAPSLSIMDAMKSKSSKSAPNFTTLVKSNPIKPTTKSTQVVTKPVVVVRDYFDFDGDD